MSKIRRLIVAGVMAVGLLGGGAAVLAADETAVVTSAPVASADYYAADNIVTVPNTINGDVYVAGGTVSVDGDVNGDVIVMGGTITVSGKVTGSIRGTGGTINVAGTVSRNVSVAAGTFNLQRGALVNGNLLVAGGNVTLLGNVDGNVQAYGGTVVFGGNVGGTVDATAGQVTVLSGAKIAKRLTYTSKNDARISSDATISGAVVHKQPPVHQGASISFGWLFSVWQLISLLVVGVSLLLLWPRFARGASKVARKRVGMSLLAGLITVIVVPVVLVILAVTLIGLPLAVVGTAIYFLAFVIGQIVTALWTGELVQSKVEQRMGLKTTFLLGAILYWIAGLIPYLGALVVLFGTLLGLGAVVLHSRTTRQSAE